jgi:hypothetical protein
MYTCAYLPYGIIVVIIAMFYLTHVIVQDAIIKYYRIGDLNKRNLFSYSSTGWKFKIQVHSEFLPRALFGL